MIELAVFDMAGTTIDDGGAVYDALAATVTGAGATLDQTDLQTWMGTDKVEAITPESGSPRRRHSGRLTCALLVPVRRSRGWRRCCVARICWSNLVRCDEPARRFWRLSATSARRCSR